MPADWHKWDLLATLEPINGDQWILYSDFSVDPSRFSPTFVLGGPNRGSRNEFRQGRDRSPGTAGPAPAILRPLFERRAHDRPTAARQSGPGGSRRPAGGLDRHGTPRAGRCRTWRR